MDHHRIKEKGGTAARNQIQERDGMVVIPVIGKARRTIITVQGHGNSRKILRKKSGNLAMHP